MNVYYQSAAMSSHSKHVRVEGHRAVKEGGSNSNSRIQYRLTFHVNLLHKIN